jgi:hypothetical protein
MRAQAYNGDQEDHLHPLRRVCPDRADRISPPSQEGEGLNSRLKIGVTSGYEEERLQGGVARAKGLKGKRLL